MESFEITDYDLDDLEFTTCPHRKFSKRQQMLRTYTFCSLISYCFDMIKVYFLYFLM